MSKIQSAALNNTLLPNYLLGYRLIKSKAYQFTHNLIKEKNSVPGKHKNVGFVERPVKLTRI